MKRASVAWGIGLISVALVAFVAMLVLWGLGVWGPGAGGCYWGPGWGSSDLRGGRSDAQVAERQFLERMIPHHEEAIAMAQVAVSRGQHQELRQLAQAIVATQTAEVVRMETWYREWFGQDLGYPPSSSKEPRDARPGWRPCRARTDGRWWASGPRGELRAGPLTAAEEFDREFIRWMVPHHQVGVMMARMALAHAKRPELRELARQIIDTQKQEIGQMRRWYREWYR